MKLEPLSALHSLAESTRARNLGEARDQASLKSSRTIAQTRRAVYTVKFEAAFYVLHAFQKKSPSGIKTARKDVELIGRRLKEARADYKVRYVKEKK
jgi:phage-related protein